MLELIFQGFLEWVYSLIVEIWGFIAGGLLDIMSLDFAYLKTHVPIIDQMEGVLLAAGWALLLGNLVFQALKSMAAGLGFEGEDPKLLFSRTFVFAFLLMASPQICRIGLDLTSNVMELLSVPDATDVGLVEEGIFGSLTAAWLMAMICSVIVMFKVLKLVIEIAERYVILALLTICAPLAFAMGGSKNTAPVFSGWCRMFGSMCLLMVTNLVCCKMLFSVVSTVPSGLDVLPWMVLIFAIVKVAHKSDAIITRIGLNPAITGGPGRTLPGMLVYNVARTAVSQVVKGVAGGGGKTARASSAGAKPGGPSAGTRFSGFRFGGAGASDGGSREGDPSGTRFRDDRANAQSTGSESRGGGRYSYNSSQYSAAGQDNARQENSAYTSTQKNSASSTTTNTARGGGRPQQTRKSSVSPGTRHPHSYVPPSDAAAPGQSGASAPKQPNGAGAAGTLSASTPRGGGRYGPAGTIPKSTAPKQPGSPKPGAAGTAGGSSTTRATHTTAQTAGGNTVNSTSHSSAQTNVNIGRNASTGQVPPTTAPRPPHPGGAAAPKPAARPDKARSTRRDKAGADPKASATPTPGAAQPSPVDKPNRSTRRPTDAAPRPGRNQPTSNAAATTGRTPSGAAPQERTPGPGRTTVKGVSPNPARQEPRKPTASAASPARAGAPTVRPGAAGTAPTGKQAAGQPRTARSRTTRAEPAHRPTTRRRGGNDHG